MSLATCQDKANKQISEQTISDTTCVEEVEFFLTCAIETVEFKYHHCHYHEQIPLAKTFTT